ncbi:hypothetical protein OE88DRAFT_1245504 [Heliocybe sulcata]|uniref:Uncharacterized protein n=1 Tax=Heliocybe sulcata TaxID=5364 RepID=A0A5C3N8G6_9AGAM|nr:hypothetical protein OE88DRAFT_1245504 [Heliocybe sulcata]
MRWTPHVGARRHAVGCIFILRLDVPNQQRHKTCSDQGDANRVSNISAAVQAAGYIYKAP